MNNVDCQIGLWHELISLCILSNSFCITGIYAYVDANGLHDSPIETGRTASLETQPLYFDTEFCLQFFYHMHGEKMGSLSIYINTGGVKEMVWSKAGNQGNKWHKAKITVPSIPVFSIKFVANVGQGTTLSDIAVDDFLVSSSLCDVPCKCN